MEDRIRVFLADDHEVVRLGLRSMLECEPDIEVVGEAADGASALEHVCETKPDVLLLDMRMPGMNGVQVCQAVRERCPDVSVVVLTSFDDDEEIFGVLGAGAMGYIMKDSKPEMVVHAIRSVAQGHAVFDSSVAGRLIAREQPQTAAEGLSEREVEVLRLMARGRSNREIAEALWIGETTVKTHVTHILRKLGCADRTQAVVHAINHGIVESK